MRLPFWANASRTNLRVKRGIGYSPTWLFDRELASGDVQQLLPDWETFDLPIHLVSPGERKHSAKVRAFAEHVGNGLGATDTS